ncbi:MAG: methionine--tRNA ligase subunit beta [Planctomycetota bacterium]|nr:methionine--tRNA ligase subunit beta [Planctomycetota bacterium]
MTTDTEPDTEPDTESETGSETTLISIDDFAKVQLRTAKVLEVEPHPKADKLWLLTVDGGGETRQIVAGVRAHYTQEELKGRTIVMVWNLQPATIRGVESRGMLLAVADQDVVRLLGPDGKVAPGCQVH